MCAYKITSPDTTLVVEYAEDILVTAPKQELIKEYHANMGILEPNDLGTGDWFLISVTYDAYDGYTLVQGSTVLFLL